MVRMPGFLRGFRGPILLLGLFLASCLPTRQAGSGTELGNVVGSIYTTKNLPAAGITVTLIPENPDSAGILAAVTDEKGNYAFQGVLGAYSLFALDGEGNGLKVDFIQDDTANPIDLERLLLSPLASLSGYAKVIGVRSEGEAEPKVEMGLSGSPFRIQVDPNSAFHWSDLPAGRYWLGISYSWAESIRIAVTLVPGETLDLDTVTLVNQYFSGIAGRDTLMVSSSQLPLVLGNKLATDIEIMDSVIWVLNGQKMAVQPTGRAMTFPLEAGMLRDTGYNVLEMRLFLKDTTVLRNWYIDLDESQVIPWARQIVKGILKGIKENPRLTPEDLKLGTFQILERRLLSEAEMAFWNWAPVPGGDTALPEIVQIPVFGNEHGNPFDCGEMSYIKEQELYPGDTVTFLTVPDEYSGGKTFRIRKNEDYSSFGNLSWFASASWPLAKLHGSGLLGASSDIRIGAKVLNIRLNRSFNGPSAGMGYCTPVARSFALGADGVPKEYVAMPSGMSSDNLLLHFRSGLPSGLFTDALAATGDYVFLDSAGYGVAGSGTDRHEVRLSAPDLAELKALLAPLPTAIPIEWNEDYFEDIWEKDYQEHKSGVSLIKSYLLSGGRGCILAGEPRSRQVPEAKLKLFQDVEAWLRSHDLL